MLRKADGSQAQSPGALAPLELVLTAKRRPTALETRGREASRKRPCQAKSHHFKEWRPPLQFSTSTGNFNNRLREIRLERGLSQIELAVQAHVSVTLISFIEKGRPVTRRKKIQIARSLKMPVTELFLSEVPDGTPRNRPPDRLGTVSGAKKSTGACSPHF